MPVAKVNEEDYLGFGSCEDAVVYSRDFEKQPVLISGASQDFTTCAVGCSFHYHDKKKLVAVFGLTGKKGTVKVLRSVESKLYYDYLYLKVAKRNGYNVVMTTSLSSDVPVGYISWSEYDVMAPVQPKTEKSLAAAFICGANNFRPEALEALEKAKLSIDSYGYCHRNHDGDGVDF